MTKETDYNENPGSDTMYMISDSPDFEEDLNEEVSYRSHPAIANSDLRYLHSPRLFQLNKQQKLFEEDKDYQRTGSLIDEFLLRKNMEDFNSKFIKEPEFDHEPTSGNQYEFVDLILEEENPLDLSKDIVAMLHSQCYKRSSEGSAWKMYTEFRPYISFQIESKDKQVYSEEDYEQLLKIEENCRAHKLLDRFLFNPAKGDQVFKHLQIIGMEKWGVSWKGELDLAVVNHVNKTIYNIDLKTTSKSISSFNYYYFRYNYKRQQALYRDLLIWWLTNQNIIPEDYSDWTIKTRVIVAKTTDLNEVYFVPVPFEVLSKGYDNLREAATKIKFYNENHWGETMSYQKNNGLEVLDWEEFLD